MPENIIIHNQWALGDTVCLSALVRDIHRAYPGKYRLLMSGHFRSYWDNSPHCTWAGVGEPGRTVKIAYKDGIKASTEGSKKHFLSWMHHDFERQTGIHAPVTEPKGEVHLTDLEKRRWVPERYWLVVAGGKRDMTSKVWYAHHYQEVVDRLARLGVHCVQGGANFTGHFHPQLKRCTSMIGRTDSIRDFFSLVYNADGIICGITAAMHLAAAFNKPCVVVAGGREDPSWEAYTNAYFPESFGPHCQPVKVEHKFLHTVGLLDCCQDRGCWKDRAYPIERADLTNEKYMRRLCKRPVRELPQVVPECMKMITPDMVVDAVSDYYRSGILPPTKPVPLPPVAALEPVSLDAYPQEMGVPLLPPELPQEVKQEDHVLSALDHPYLGGKVTICVLCYGDHLDLAKRCLGSIMHHCPQHRMDLRVALNQPSGRLLDYVQGFDRSRISKLYVDHGTRRKYPAMREMFWDPEHPINTKFVLWFDDDSHVGEADWLDRLAREIIANHAQQVRMYGCKYVHDLMTYKKQGYNPEKWFQSAPWWHGRPMHTAGGTQLAPNGSQIVFASGGFWAIATEAIRAANIPDARLNHNGGDITIGEQLHQAGFRLKDFCRGKRPVRWSDAPRRGYSEEFPWSKVA